MLSFATICFRISIWLASGNLYAQAVNAEFVPCFYWAIALYLMSLPFIHVAGALHSYYGVVFLYYFLSLACDQSRENIVKSLRQITSWLLWALAVITFHQQESPFALAQVNEKIFAISSSKKYVMIAFSCLYFLFQANAPKLIILRACSHFRRTYRTLTLIKKSVLKILLFYTVMWLPRQKESLRELFYNCVTSFVQYTVYQGLYHGYVKLSGESDLFEHIKLRIYLLNIVLLLIRNIYRQQWQFIAETELLNITIKCQQPYKYDLLSSPRSVRLLLLHPRHTFAPINCSLFQTVLEYAPAYEAVSYTWGSSTAQHVITVNNSNFFVTSNAYDLLKERSSFWLPKLIWIDSVCINQKDHVEKTRQVDLMGDIYRKAFVVTVCLSHAIRPVSLIWDLNSSFDAHRALDMLEEVRLVAFALSSEEDMLYRTIAFQARSKRWYSMLNLLKNPWYERVWIVQEVALARSVRVVYEGREMPWKEFVDSIATFTQHPHLLPLLERTEDFRLRQTPPSGALHTAQTENFRQRVQSGKRRQFSEIISSCRHCKATDPRDKVFGILGLCSKSKVLPRPNYSESYSLRQVHLDAARCMLYEEGIDRILSQAGVGHFPNDNPLFGTEKLPSWVPDWTRQQPNLPLARPEQARYEIEGLSDQKTFLIAQIRLGVSGHFVDTIKELGPVLDVSWNDAEKWFVHDLKRINHALGLSYDLVAESQNTYFHTSPPQPIFEAFWRTLICNRTIQEDDVPVTFAENFLQWMQIVTYYKNQTSPSYPGASPSASSEVISRFPLAAGFARAAASGCFGRRLCIGYRGYIGIVPPYANINDSIYVLHDAKIPVVTRPKDVAALLVGECYIHGIGRDWHGWRDPIHSFNLV